MTLKINNMLHVWHVWHVVVAPASVVIRTNGMATLQHQRRNEDDNEYIRDGGRGGLNPFRRGTLRAQNAGNRDRTFGP